MSLAIPVPFAARRNRHRAYELTQEAALPLEHELPTAVVVRDIGEERALRDAWHKCGRQVLRALNNKAPAGNVDRDYENTKQRIISKCMRPNSMPLQSYEVTDRPVIMAMARFSMQPPYEHPLVELDRQVAGAMLQEQPEPIRNEQPEHATI